MTASLISPSGKVLLHRARCSGEAGSDPFATTVRVRAVPERTHAASEQLRAATSTPTPHGETEREELDTAG